MRTNNNVRNCDINVYLGHEHKSVFVRNGAQQVFANQKGFVNLNIMDSSIVKEIIVPSCNYRLGNTGYGAAIVSKYSSPISSFSKRK